MVNNCLSIPPRYSNKFSQKTHQIQKRQKKRESLFTLHIGKERVYHSIALLRNGLWSSLTGATSHAKSISTLLALFQNCNIYQKSRAAADRLLRWQLWLLLLVSLAIEIRYYRHLRALRQSRKKVVRSQKSP